MFGYVAIRCSNVDVFYFVAHSIVMAICGVIINWFSHKLVTKTLNVGYMANLYYWFFNVYKAITTTS